MCDQEIARFMRKALQDAKTVVFFNSGADLSRDGASQLAQTTFCPDVNSSDASATGPIGVNPQKVYPNMLFSSLVRGKLLYVPNVGAQPEPPVRFNVNIQGLVGVLNRVRGTETDRSLNLNSQVAKETQPAVADETKSLDRVFLNDLVALDADRRGRDFLFVSRGANYVMRASLDSNGKLNILGANSKMRTAMAASTFRYATSIPSPIATRHRTTAGRAARRATMTATAIT